MKHFIIATAGHVDHGKSALVKALTGTDPDRLPEEKARQITIDLGFAELSLDGPGGAKIQAGIVDVPGHEDFVRNMIAGFGAVDLALLVVAADDGWMPQTEEHLQILTYLGVSRAVVALTKFDLGGVEKTAIQIHDQLRDTKFADSPVVPISVRNGDGMEKLKQTLTSMLSAMEPERDVGKPRLFVGSRFQFARNRHRRDRHIDWRNASAGSNCCRATARSRVSHSFHSNSRPPCRSCATRNTDRNQSPRFGNG